MINGIKVVIPLQLASTRIKRKNVRPFYEGKSLFDIKAEQILETGFDANQIYVSSESDEVRELCSKYGFNFLKRPEYLTGNSIKQPDLIGNIISMLPKDDDDILWVQVTNPLFTGFKEIIDSWNDVKEKGFDSIIAVKTLRHHIVNEKGIPVNFNFGHWHRVSQDLPKFYEILWSAFLLQRSTIEKVKYHIGMNPYYMPFDKVTTIDIDEMEDFTLAALIYKMEKENK